VIRGSSEQARVIVAIIVSITFFGLNLRFQPLREQDNASLATLSHLALILLYMCVLTVKTCELSPVVCSSYGFGNSAKGSFLLFIFSSLAMLAVQLLFEAAAIAYHIRMLKKLRRLRYRGGRLVELPPVAEKEFLHLPGLEPSPCFHIFLSHAWPIGQDVCKLIKQRCREICPSLHVFLDVEDLATGSGTKEVDHSRCILVFAMPVYFQKINCVKEMTRAIVRKKQITLLLPDAEVHGTFTTAMIGEVVTDEWVQKWKLDKKFAEWARDWGVAEVKTPTGAEICDALFQQPPLEWSRITTFQDCTMVLMCRRLLPKTEKRDVYLQGADSFRLPKGHRAVSLYCSPHNPGARELAEELNGIWPGLLKIANVQSWADLGACDHMLVCLNAQTWTYDPEPFAAEVREAAHADLHLQPCHEYPSVVDPGSARQALEFKQIMDATPADLKKWPTNLFSQIAIALKGGELREPGLANLAQRLAQRHGKTKFKTTYGDAAVGSNSNYRKYSHTEANSSLRSDALPRRVGFLSALQGLVANLSQSASTKLRSLSKSSSTVSTPATPTLGNLPRLDVAVGAEHPSSFRDTLGSRISAVVDNAPQASAAGALSAESSV